MNLNKDNDFDSHKLFNCAMLSPWPEESLIPITSFSSAREATVKGLTVDLTFCGIL